MTDELWNKIDGIYEKILSRELFKEHPHDGEFFGGADVMITDTFRSDHQRFIRDQPFVIGMDDSAFIPRRRVVVTHHAAILSALFYGFRDHSGDIITAMNKYEFYGTLAQTAIDFIETRGDPDDARDLLKEVYQVGRSFLEMHQ